MNYDWLDLLSHGFYDLPWWGYIVVTLALTHVTIAAVTIFLHRCQALRWCRTSSASGCGSPPAW
jgi:stearoyl-CoA desaturase (Delta-9 desaturase)